MFLYSRRFTVGQLGKMACLLGITASPLLLRALCKGPLKGFEFSARVFESYHELLRRDPIPELTLLELGNGAETGQQLWLDPAQPSREMSPGELAVLCWLVKWKQPRVVVEIGTYRGFTTQHMSRNTADACRIYTVDLPSQVALANPTGFSDPQLVKAAAGAERVFGNDPKITQILQDSTTVDWKKFLDRPVDFALVDASHLYPHVQADTEGIMKVLAPHAIVLWHDYRPVEIRRGVKRYLDGLGKAGLPIKRVANTSFCIYQHASSATAARVFAA
jgi:Methyltransferase domain